MIKPTQSLEAVRRKIKDLYGQTVEVSENLGRNKYVTFTGVLSGLYPSLFSVAPSDPAYRGRTAYSYADAVCGKVRLSRLHTEAENPTKKEGIF